MTGVLIQRGDLDTQTAGQRLSRGKTMGGPSKTMTGCLQAHERSFRRKQPSQHLDPGLPASRLGDKKMSAVHPTRPEVFSDSGWSRRAHTAFHPVPGHPHSTSSPSLRSHTRAAPPTTSKLRAFLKAGCHTGCVFMSFATTSQV